MDLIVPNSEVLCRLCLACFLVTCGISSSTSLAISIKTFVVIRQVSTLQPPAFSSKKSTYIQITSVCTVWTIMSFCASHINSETTDFKPGCRIGNGMVDKAFLLILSVLSFTHVVGICLCQFGIFYTVKRQTVGLMLSVACPISENERMEVLGCKDAKANTRQDPHSHLDDKPVSMATLSAENLEKREIKHSRTSCSSSGHPPLKNLCQNASEKQDVFSANYMLEKMRYRILQLTKLTTTVVVVYTICILPIGVVFALHSSCFSDDCVDYDQWILLTATFLGIHSLMNFVVYTLKSREFRRYFKDILCCSVTSEELGPPRSRSNSRISTNDTHL